MTKEEIISKGAPVEPNSFETDREEQWYKAGLYEGARLRKFKWRTDLHPMNGEVVLLMMGGVPVVGKYDTKREAWCRHTDIGFEVVMYQEQVTAWSYIPECREEEK